MSKILVFLFLVLLVLALRPAWTSLLVGLTIAVVLDPLVCRLTDRLAGHRLPAVLLAYLAVLAALAALGWGIADLVTGGLSAPTMQNAAEALHHYYLAYRPLLTELFGISADPDQLTRLLRALGSGAFRGLIGAVFGVYLLKDKSFFLQLGNKTLHLLLPQKIHGIVREVLLEINGVLAAFLRGVFVDSSIVAVLSTLALVVVGVEAAPVIGCFVGLCNVIPYFGPFLGILPAAAMALATGGLSRAILAVVLLVLIQQLEANLIYPRIIGAGTGLHPLFVLLAVSAAGAAGGLLWMILAVPLAGVVRVLLCKWAACQ